MNANVTRLIRDTRPQPPEMRVFNAFAPDQDGLGAWARRTFIDDDGPLTNDRHAHLQAADIGWLWTTAEATNKNRRIAGECRQIQTMQKRWSSAAAHWQLEQWFGQVPDFLITIDAHFAAQADDWTFCAVIEHELCHAAQAEDEFGMPRFTKQGLPIFCTVAHEVEEFVDVVARYGAQATGVSDMVAAANRGPSIGQAAMDMACGTCARRVA